MTAKDLIRQLDLMRIALGLETRAEREARVERVVKDYGVRMWRYGDGVMIRLKDGQRALISAKAFQ